MRDHVELHFDGPVLRALSDPLGVYGGREWHFPAPGSLDLMRCYIGMTVDGYEEDPERILALHFGEHRFQNRNFRTSAVTLHKTGPQKGALERLSSTAVCDPALPT